ncbi:MAG: TraB/GumN family protein [Devosia sp.]
MRTLLLSAAFCLLSVSATQAAPALWEISDADSKVTLFGSVHVLPEGKQWRTPAFDTALAGADKVYFEADIGFFNQLYMAFQLVTGAFNTTGERWQDNLSPDEAGAVGAAIEPLGMTLEQAQTYRPWFISMMIEGQSVNAGGAQLGSGVEMTVQREVPRERRGYLETAAQQIAIISNMPDDLQLQFLVQTAVESAPSGTGLDEIVAAWESGDDQALLELLGDDAQLGDAAAMQLVLFDRNANWIPAIEAMLAANENDLIIVGAAHLVGDKGVVELLRAKGYSIHRVQ